MAEPKSKPTLLQERLSLIRNVWDIRMRLEAICVRHAGPRRLEPELLGLIANNAIVEKNGEAHTTCLGCSNELPITVRFLASGGDGETPLLARRKVMSELDAFHPPLNLRNVYPSILLHFGCPGNAFRAACAEFGRELPPLPNPPDDWRLKVVPCLGIMPNAMIAQVVGVLECTVEELRLSRGARQYEPGRVREA